MPMTESGLHKLSEECGELTTVIAKMLAYPGKDDHPDGKGSLRSRLQEELSDVVASCIYVECKMRLDGSAIENRINQKLALYRQWEQEEQS